MQHNFDVIDRLTMGLAAALLLVGIVVLGIAELLDGAPFSPTPITNDAGEIVASPLVDPNVRTGLVLLGLLVLLLWGLYRLVQPTLVSGEARRDVVAPE